MSKEEDFEILPRGTDDITMYVGTEEGQRFTAWNPKLPCEHGGPKRNVPFQYDSTNIILTDRISYDSRSRRRRPIGLAAWPDFSST
jgi:hypothetical protein